MSWRYVMRVLSASLLLGRPMQGSCQASVMMLVLLRPRYCHRASVGQMKGRALFWRCRQTRTTRNTDDAAMGGVVLVSHRAACSHAVLMLSSMEWSPSTSHLVLSWLSLPHFIQSCIAVEFRFMASHLWQ